MPQGDAGQFSTRIFTVRLFKLCRGSRGPYVQTTDVGFRFVTRDGSRVPLDRRFTDGQSWLTEQCRFEFVRFVRFEAEQNKGIVRKLQNRTDPLFGSGSSRTELFRTFA